MLSIHNTQYPERTALITTFQSRMNEVFVDYPVKDLIMNSDMPRVHQSMTPTTTLCPVGMPANIDTGVFTNSVAGVMCTFTAAGSILPIWFTIPTS